MNLRTKSLTTVTNPVLVWNLFPYTYSGVEHQLPAEEFHLQAIKWL